MKSPFLKDEIVRLQMGYPATFDPIMLEETIGKEIIDNIYEKLVFYEGKSFVKFSSYLAEKWDISDNGKLYTFYIRKGVTFHDGAKLDAKAVCVSLRRMAELSKHKVVKETLIKENINCTDEYTVQILLKVEFPGFLHLIASQEAAIISPKLIDRLNNEDIGDDLKYNCCGTGPYFLKSYDSREAVLEANKGYWNSPPEISKVRIVFEDDINIRKSMFLNENVDISIDEGNDISEYAMKEDITIENNKSLDITYISFNLSSSYMKNILFRKALCHSLNVKGYIKETRKGYAFEVKGIIPEGLLGFEDDIQVPEYDMELARSCIDKCGVNIMDMPVLKVLLPLGNGKDHYIERYWKKNLKSLGIEIEIEYCAWQNFLGKLNDGEFDVYSLAWAPDYPDPDNYVFQLLHSKGRIANYMRLEECYGKFIDNLIEEARFTSNESVRDKCYKTIQHICAEHYLYIPLYQINDLKVYKKWIKNVMYNPLYGDYYFYPIKLEGRC